MNPPPQPPSSLSQSTSSCSERLSSFPFLMNCWPSMLPLTEKAQQEPHMPWFLTSVTAPWSLQSKASGRSMSGMVAGGQWISGGSLPADLAGLQGRHAGAPPTA